MKNHSLTTFILASCVAMSLTACISAPKKPPLEAQQRSVQKQSKEPLIADISADERSQLYFSILLANIAEKNRMYEVAQSNFIDAADKTGSVQLAKKAASVALKQHDFQAMLDSGNLLKAHSPKDPDTYKILFIAHIALNNFLVAKTELLELIALLEQDKDQQFYQLAQLLAFQEATKLQLFFEQYPELRSNAVLTALEAYLQLQQDNLQAPQLENIYNLLDNSLILDETFLTAIELKGEALKHQSKELRDNYFLAIVRQKKLGTEKTFKLAELLYSQKNYLAAIEAFHQILESDNQHLEAKYLLAGSYYAKEDYHNSAELFDELAKAEYKKEISSYYCADSALRIDNKTLAMTCYETVPVGTYFFTSRTQLAQLYAELGYWQQGSESLEQAQRTVSLGEKKRLLHFQINYLLQLQQYALAQQKITNALQIEPDNPSLFYLQLQLFNQTQSVEEFLQSIDMLQQQASSDSLHKEISYIGAGFLQARSSHLLAYKLLEKQSLLYPDDMDILYTKALAGEPIGYSAQMERELRYILQQQPQHIDAKNALGYTLADNNRSLDEALQLIKEAYQEDPDSSAIQDSMGWIHYRLGNLDIALEFLQKAYDKTPLPEIAAHLGEVLWTLNQRHSAKEIWKKALQLEPNNQYILQTLERFPEANIDA